VYGLI